MGDADIDKVMFMLEVTWWAHRSLWHLLFAGVLERHPDLQFVFTEQGTAWIPETLGTLDFFFDRMGHSHRVPGARVGAVGGLPAVACGRVSTGPANATSDRASCARRKRPCAMPVGVDTIMWGSDYPHKESSYPFSMEALRLSFAGIDPIEVQAMLGGNAARLFGFDLEASVRWPHGSGRPTIRLACHSAPTRFRQTPGGVRPSPGSSR